MTRAAAPRPRPALLLDEMHSHVVAAALRDRGHDALAVVEKVELRALTDDEVFLWALGQGRRIVTENVKDFRRILVAAEEAGRPVVPLLYTSSRSFPRSRRNPGLLVDALDAWLRRPDVGRRPLEDWLQPAG